MPMTLYSDSRYPVSPRLETLHVGELQSYARSGTWGTAAQRTAIAATARIAHCEHGSQESVGDEELAARAKLPDAAVRLARAVAVDSQNIDRKFCRDIQAQGVSEGAYVEIVALVSRLSNLDVFARGLGIPVRKLLEPADETRPSFERPAEAVDEGFFTASVPSAPQGGALAESLYGESPAGNIFRAVSLVPDEARRVMSLVSRQYFGAEHLLNFHAASDHALSRAQIELVATKVSEHNQCFY